MTDTEVLQALHILDFRDFYKERLAIILEGSMISYHDASKFAYERTRLYFGLANKGQSDRQVSYKRQELKQYQEKGGSK